jgi:hypothetical protein
MQVTMHSLCYRNARYSRLCVVPTSDGIQKTRFNRAGLCSCNAVHLYSKGIWGEPQSGYSTTEDFCAFPSSLWVNDGPMLCCKPHLPLVKFFVLTYSPCITIFPYLYFASAAEWNNVPKINSCYIFVTSGNNWFWVRSEKEKHLLLWPPIVFSFTVLTKRFA